MEGKEITVIGLGGVGGYFAYKLATAFSAQAEPVIIFVARGATYEVVKQNGLKLISPEHVPIPIKPDRLIQNVDALESVDVALVCVKEYDLERVCQELKGKVTGGSVVLPLMNGVDIYDRIRRVLPDCVILPACVYVASHIKEKGIVEHKGNAGRIIFGRDPQYPHFMPKGLVALFTEANIQFQFRDDASPDIWTKFLFIASFGLVTARYNLPIGVVNKEEEMRERARLIMLEIKTIAKLKGVDLPPDIVEATFQKAATFPYETPTSLQLDIHSKKPANELDLFAGAIFRYGEEVKASTVATRKIHEEIKNIMEKQ